MPDLPAVGEWEPRVGEDATGSRTQGDLPDGAVLFIR